MVALVILFIYGFGSFIAYVICLLYYICIGKDGREEMEKRRKQAEYDALTPEMKALIKDTRKDLERISAEIEFTKKFREEDERKRKELHRQIVEDTNRRIAAAKAKKEAEEAEKAREAAEKAKT